MADGGLLGGIMNPAQADVLGAMDKGKKRQALEMAGEIMGQTQYGKLGALYRTDVELGDKVANALGIPKGATGRIEAMKGAYTLANQFAQAGDNETAAAVMDDYVSMIQGSSQGQEMAAIAQRGAAGLRNGDPEAIQNLNAIVGSFSAQPSAKDQSITDLNNARTADLGKSDGPSNLPAEAVAFNDLIKDFTPEQQKTAKLVKAGLKGRSMSNAVLSAIESGDVTNLAEATAEIRQAEKFAELTGASRGNAIDKGFESIVKIDAGIRNIDNGIAALDAGAGVGAIEKMWPSIKSASVALDNVRGQMALDVVGATTFGALSKGELDLAKDIALPTGMDTPELRKYLIDKKAAQGKLRGWYNEQIQFLDQGGTVAGFLRKKSREQGESTSDSGQTGLSDAELLNKYK